MLKGRGALDRNLALGCRRRGGMSDAVGRGCRYLAWSFFYLYLFYALRGFPLCFSTLGFQDKP